MKRPGIAAKIDRAWWDLARACERSTLLDGLLRKAVGASTVEERGHRGVMRDFRRYHPKALSVETCARYFVLKWFHEPFAPNPSWLVAGSVREDVLYSRALREAFAHNRETAPEIPEWLSATEYTELVGKVADL